jgi:hypothetical protein
MTAPDKDGKMIPAGFNVREKIRDIVRIREIPPEFIA